MSTPDAKQATSAQDPMLLLLLLLGGKAGTGNVAAGHPSEGTTPMIELKVNRRFIGNLMLLLKLLYLLFGGRGGGCARRTKSSIARLISTTREA